MIVRQYSKEQEADKQNLSIFSNFKGKYRAYSVQKQQDITRICDMDCLQSDSDVEQGEEKIQLMRKKYFVKRIIAGILRKRREEDVSLSRILVCQDHLKFKIFDFWQRMCNKTRNRIAQAEVLAQTKRFSLLRRVFKEWNDSVRKPKQQILQRKRQIFQAFKIVCSIELYLRIRKINLTTFLIRSRGKEFISRLFDDNIVMRRDYKNAEQHWRSTVLKRSFERLSRNNKRQKYEQLRYKKYKMANLFHKKTLLTRSFKTLLPVK